MVKYLVLTSNDISELSPSTRAELMATCFKAVDDESRFPRDTSDYNWEGRVDLNYEQIVEYLEGCSPETVSGLKFIAEEGPLIAADELKKVGIDNFGHFQGRTTKRARTITGNKNAFLLAWDDWADEHNQQYGCGHYAVTIKTHESLMRYFDM